MHTTNLYIDFMSDYMLGVCLMVAGLVLFLVGRGRSKRKSVGASAGSVAIGGANNAAITNVNVGANKDHSGHGLTILSVIVEVIGIIVVLWHAIHLTAK